MAPPQPGVFEYSSDLYPPENYPASSRSRKTGGGGGAASSSSRSQRPPAIGAADAYSNGTGGGAQLNGGASSYDIIDVRPGTKITSGRGYQNGVTSGAGSRAMDEAPSLSVAVAGSKRKRDLDRLAKYSQEQWSNREPITRAALLSLTESTHKLHTKPSEDPDFTLKLYPTALERGALLGTIDLQETHELETCHKLWNAEIKQIEEEFKRGKARLLERISEGLEERRRRAREEKEGEGVVAVESSLEATASALSRSSDSKPSAPFALSAPIPYGLSPEDLASPFPLSLNSITSSHGHGYAGSSHTGAGPGRKPRLGRVPGGGVGSASGGTASSSKDVNAMLTLGKAISQITGLKDVDAQDDAQHIRKHMKRRKAAAKTDGKALV